jgi:hypothetical protein
VFSFLLTAEPAESDDLDKKRLGGELVIRL